MNKHFLKNNTNGIDIKQMADKYGITPISAIILCNRDLKTPDAIKKILSNDIRDINDEKLLPDIEKATEIIINKIIEKKKIRIIGDYDIDGVCATYILYDGLKYLDAQVTYAVPDRVKDGYGINISMIDDAINDGIDTIITCDNGIAAEKEIAYAKAHGIDTIVTDHHDISSLPESAVAVVDPKRIDVNPVYPFTEICGATVAWKVITYLYKKLKVDVDPIEKYLEFAMLATVGDIMPLIDENHIIAKLGLKKIIKTENKGLKKLLDVSQILNNGKEITAYHIGFIIGPLINAAGRMENAKLALSLFTATENETICAIADKLKTLNDERKQMTENGVTTAIEIIEKDYINDKVLVIYVPGLGEQVAGIVAGRIKEQYNKPTIILTDTCETDVLKASCRSIEAYDIFTALNKHKEMLLKFGGHKLAAGFSILKDNIDELRKLLNDEAMLTSDDFVKKVYIDAEYLFTHISENTIIDMNRLLPFGQGFKEPLFATRDVKIKIDKIFGEARNVVRLKLEKDGKEAKGIIFTDGDAMTKDLEKQDTFSIVYYPKINEYNGYKSVQINVIEYF